jgi:hypothetical protein
VIAALEGEEAMPPCLTLVAPILIGEFEGDLHTGRTIVGVEDAFELGGQQRR